MVSVSSMDVCAFNMWTLIQIAILFLSWTTKESAATKAYPKRVLPPALSKDPSQNPNGDPNLRGFKPISPPPHSGEYINSHSRGYPPFEDSAPYPSSETKQYNEPNGDYLPSYQSTEGKPKNNRHPPKRLSSIENRMRSAKGAQPIAKKPQPKFNHSLENTRRKPKRYTKPGLAPPRLHADKPPLNNVKITGGFKPIKNPLFSSGPSSFQVTKNWHDHPLDDAEHKEFMQHEYDFKHNFRDPGFESSKTVNYTTIHRKEKPPLLSTASSGASFTLPAYDFEDQSYTKYSPSYDTYGGDTVLDLPPYVAPVKDWHKNVPSELEDDSVEQGRVYYHEHKYVHEHDHNEHKHKPTHKHSHKNHGNHHHHHDDHSGERDSSHEHHHHSDHDSHHKHHHDHHHKGHHDHDHDHHHKHGHHEDHGHDHKHSHKHSHKHKHKRNHGRNQVIKIMHHG